MKQFMKRLGILLALAAITAGLSACREGQPEEVRADMFALDTYITFTLFGGDAQKGIDAAKARIQEIEETMSVHVPGSDVDRINQQAGIAPVRVGADTFFVVQKAVQYSAATQGAFDVTIYPIQQLWDIMGDNPRIPEAEEIQALLPLVNYEGIQLDQENRTVYLEKAGMRMDLGGIAKGYAGDEAVRLLKAHGVLHGLINLGGDILVFGGKPDGTRWRIGVQDPRAGAGSRHFAVIELFEGSIVTSGDYERYMVDIYEETGVRYHHIFDPETGYPADTGLISTTVIGAAAVDTDALSTALFVLGKERGMALMETLEGVHGVLVSQDKRVWITEGFADQIRITNPIYRTD